MCRSPGFLRVTVAAMSAAAVGACGGAAADDASIPGLRRVGTIGGPDRFGFVTDIEAIGDRLVVLDAKPARRESFVNVFGPAEGDEVAFGRAGPGPGEFSQPLRILAPFSGSDDPFAFAVFDGVALRTHVYFEWNDFAATPTQLLGPTALFLGMWLDQSGALMASGWFHDAVGGIYEIDWASREIIERGKWGEPLHADAGPRIVPRLNVSSSAVHPDRDRVALAYLLEPQVRIWSLPDGNLLHAVTSEGDWELVYEIRNLPEVGTFADTVDESRHAYLDVTATTDRIFALFSGRTLGSGGANESSELHVLAWDGTLLHRVVARGFYAVTVSSSRGSLFLLRIDPYPVIEEYRLDADLTGK